MQPDVRRVQLTPADRFLLLACDGIWDVMTNQQVDCAAAAPSRICDPVLLLRRSQPASKHTAASSRSLLHICRGGTLHDTLQAVEFVNTRLDRGVEAGVICQELLDACLAKNPKEARGIGCDNMTANIVVFKK